MIRRISRSWLRFDARRLRRAVQRAALAADRAHPCLRRRVREPDSFTGLRAAQLRALAGAPGFHPQGRRHRNVAL